jgi:hypothetical protein
MSYVLETFIGGDDRLAVHDRFGQMLRQGEVSDTVHSSGSCQAGGEGLRETEEKVYLLDQPGRGRHRPMQSA